MNKKAEGGRGDYVVGVSVGVIFFIGYLSYYGYSLEFTSEGGRGGGGDVEYLTLISAYILYL